MRRRNLDDLARAHARKGLLPDSVDIGAIYGDVGENPTVRSLYQRLRDADPASSLAAGGADPTPDCGAHAEHPDAGMQTHAEGKRAAEPAWTGDEPARTPSATDLSHSRGGSHHAEAPHAHDLPCAIETAASADAAASDPALSMILCDPHDRAADAPAGSGGEVGGGMGVCACGCVRMWVCAHVACGCAHTRRPSTNPPSRTDPPTHSYTQVFPNLVQVFQKIGQDS